MPTFNYKCESCGEIFEKFVLKNTEVKCPKCSSKEVKKTLTAPSGIVIKGGY